MRKLLLFIAVAGVVYYVLQQTYLKTEKDSVPAKADMSAFRFKTPLRIVYFQDVSGSIKVNGVELVSSAVFNPYFIETSRTIELNFGVIANLSARKLLTVSLPAATFQAPVIPDFRSASITEKRKNKERYLNEQSAYEADSIRYHKERKALIARFSSQVDSIINIYREKLAGETDLATATSIADKVFNFSQSDGARNFLILNSDGLDSYRRVVKKLNNPAEVILVNASGITKTSIDAILTKTLQSSEQAVEYTLINSLQAKL